MKNLLQKKNEEIPGLKAQINMLWRRLYHVVHIHLLIEKDICNCQNISIMLPCFCVCLYHVVHIHLLIEKDICDCQNISIMLPCVCVCL